MTFIAWYRKTASPDEWKYLRDGCGSIIQSRDDIWLWRRIRDNYSAPLIEVVVLPATESPVGIPRSEWGRV